MPDMSATAALISSWVALIAVAVSYRKLKQDLARLEVEKMSVEAQFGQELSAERAARNLLACTRWKRRTFSALQYHLGGYEENELRRILIRAGAVRFNEDVETWGLIQRNTLELEDERFTGHF